MEFATNNISNFPNHMLAASLPTPIWNLMDDLIETKTEGTHEFDTFLHDALQHSDSDNDSLHNITSEQTRLRNSVSEDETPMSCPVTQEIGSQICFANGVLSQGPSLGSCYEMSPNRFEWTSFEQPTPIDALSPSDSQVMAHNPDIVHQRRSSLPESGPDFPDLANGRKRVFSWGDLNDTSAVLHDMDWAQPTRRSSVNIPLHHTKNIFINGLSQSNGPIVDEKSNDCGDSAQHTQCEESSSSRGDTNNDPEVPQNAVEKRLNRRRERNRLAARRSREKRTQFLRDLEGLNQALRNENCALKAKLCDVLQELEALRATSTLH